MKLLAFVLLGFLAHSCSGTYETSQPVFQDHVCDVFDKNFESYEGCDLLPFNILNLGQVIASVTGLLSLKTDITYQSNDIYKLVIGGALNLNSLSITGLGLSIHINGQLRVFVNKGCLEAEMIEGSLEIDIQVANQAVFIGIGGVLGGLTGILTKTIINTFTSNCQQLLPGTILEIIQSSITIFNTNNKDIATPVYHYGNWFNLEIREIECTAESIVQYVDVAIKTSADAVATKVSLGSNEAAGLAEGVGSSICFTNFFIDIVINAVFDNVIPNYKKTLTNTQWQQYGVYPGIQGDPTVSVKKTKKPSCNIQPSGSSVSVSVELEVADGAGHSFLNVDVDLDIELGLSRSNGITRLSLGGESISNKHVSNKDDECGCEDDDALLEIIGGLIVDIVTDVVEALTAALNQGLPCVDSLTQTWQPESQCAGGDQVFQCSCNEY